MKLPFSLLFTQLQKTYPALEGRPYQSKLTFGRPVLYDPGASFPAEKIVLLEEPPSALTEFPKRTLFVFPNTPDLSENFCFRSSYLVLHGTDSTAHVCNILQQLFDLYEDWEQKLSHALLTGSTIQQLLTLAFPMLGCPLYLMSRGFSMVASVGQDLLPQENQIFQDAQKTIDYINSMKQNEFYNQSLHFEEPYLFPEHLTGIRSWNVNIQQLGHTTHRLMMLEHPRAFQEGDAYLLNILASYLKYLLYHDTDTQVASENSLRSIFLRLLSDSTADYMETSHKLTSLGWESTHEYMTAVLQVTFLDQQNMTTGAICSYIEELLPASCCIPFRKDIVVYFNLSLLQMGREEASEKLTVFIRDSYFKAGYSRTMTGHMNLRRQYTQACLALEVGCRKNPYIWIHHFNQIALQYLLEQATKRLPAHMICHEALLRLRAVDQSQGTDYMRTLRTYLDNHLNAAQTSKDLFIHRSTFLYRLDRIKEILETDLDDVDELLYLLLSFRLLDLEEGEREEMP